VGNELTIGADWSVGPIGIPVPATGVPGLVPSGEVVLSGGMIVPMPAWAKTGPQQQEAETIAMTNISLMRTPQIKRSAARWRSCPPDDGQTNQTRMHSSLCGDGVGRSQFH
jgi:hypothetical protein